MPGIENVGSPRLPSSVAELRPEELRPEALTAQDPAQPSVPTAPSTTEPGALPADPATVAAARGRALAGEQQSRERLEQRPASTTPGATRPARGLQRPDGPTPPTTPGAAPADLEQRVERLEEAGRRRAFAQSPEAAAAHARDVAAVLPHVDGDTRRALQRPLDEFAEGAARGGNPRDAATAAALAPALGIRGVDAFATVLQSQPSPAAREGAVNVLAGVARTNADPLVRRHAEGGILNDRPTVEAALRGTHPTLSRDSLVAMAAPRPERVNQLVGVAEQLGPDVARDLAERGLSRTQLPELGGVLGGIVDGVDGLTAPLTRPVETATGIARLGAALVTDPIGTGRQIANGVVEAVTEDPARAITGAVVGLAGGAAVGAAGRAGVAGRAGRAGRAADDLPPSTLEPPTTFQHGNIRGTTPLEFEQALEANGYRRVMGGDMQNVFERNGEYVKVARSSSDDVRQRRPDIAAQRDAENRAVTTEQEFVFARLRQEFPGLVPETRRIGPSAIAQQGAPGMSIRDLPWDVRETAMRNAGELRLEAQRRLGGRYLDPNIYNFTFDQTGRVVSWFDPM